MNRLRYTSLTLAAGALSLSGTLAQADQVILDDLIVDGSACIGFDCVNGESFGFDTIRIKENNLRIKAQDTSNTASFPSNDWQITFNETSNGGANKFSIDDIDGGRTPFTIEAGAPSHSLYVDDGGRIGFGTSTPVVELHVKDGDTPTLRLEQDGSSGFTPQTFDVAANETNFFVRDATNGSTLPFRIRPGAPTSAIDVAGDGDVGVGTASPGAQLHVRFSESDVNDALGLLVENTNTSTGLLADFTAGGTGANGFVQIRLKGDTTNNRRIIGLDGAGNQVSQISLNDSSIQFAGATVTGANLWAEISASGLAVGGTTLNVPDYVFADDYQLMPLAEVETFVLENSHLPNVPSAAEIQAGGLNMTQMQLTLLEKVEELTLYTLQQQAEIETLEGRLEALTAE